MLKFLLVVPAVAGLVEARLLRPRRVKQETGAGSVKTSDSSSVETSESSSAETPDSSSSRSLGRVGPHYPTWWGTWGLADSLDKSSTKFESGIEAMGRMIQEVEDPVEKLGDDEIKAIEGVGPFTNASELFLEASWANSSSRFIRPVIFCIKDLIEKQGVSHYRNDLMGAKDQKKFCDFLGRAQIVPEATLARYVDALFAQVTDSYTDTFAFACADCAQSWESYNPTRPPRPYNRTAGYNPTRPPIDYNPTMPPLDYNPTMPPLGYNPTMPPLDITTPDIGYNPTMPPTLG